MSLISFRNLSAPLRSKFQIGALVIIALLVAVVRYGAADRTARVGSARVPAGVAQSVDLEAHREEIIDFLDETEKHLKRNGTKQSDSELEGLVDGSYEKSVRRKQSETQANGKFDDIRKSLGLE